jgi:NAD(P)H-dependent nitrite reductase small subunit
MKKFYPVCSIYDVRSGKGKKIRINNKTIALFKYKNNVYAIQNRCPHQNADLANGYIKDDKVYCSLHHWSFNIFNGAYSFNPKVSIQTYEVKVENDKIFVGIEII